MALDYSKDGKEVWYLYHDNSRTSREVKGALLRLADREDFKVEERMTGDREPTISSRHIFM